MTCEIVSPLTSIIWRTSLGVASVWTKHAQTRIFQQQIKQEKVEEEEEKRKKHDDGWWLLWLTFLASKPLNGLNKAAVKIRSPSQTRHFWPYVWSHRSISSTRTHPLILLPLLSHLKNTHTKFTTKRDFLDYKDKNKLLHCGWVCDTYKSNSTVKCVERDKRRGEGDEKGRRKGRDVE